jgi:hypothetical protein
MDEREFKHQSLAQLTLELNHQNKALRDLRSFQGELVKIDDLIQQMIAAGEQNRSRVQAAMVPLVPEVDADD